MSGRKISLIIMACGFLMFTLAACGDDTNCTDVCDKAWSCGLNIPNCKTACDNAPNQDCGLSCDTDDSCAEYGGCILNCGLTQEPNPN